MTYIPGGSGGSVSTSTDVALNNPAQGHVLSYDTNLSKWVNTNAVASGKGSVIYDVRNSTYGPRPAGYDTVEWVGPVDPGAAALDYDTWVKTVDGSTVVDLYMRISGAWKVASLNGVSPNPDFTPIYINAGGPSVTEGTVTYAADNYFSGGTAYTTTNTAQLDALPAHLESARYDMSTYKFPASRRVNVRLHMIEYTFTAAGKRIFSVYANGGLVIQDLDLFATAGQGIVVSRDIIVDPVDGAVNISFAASMDNAIVSAIEVLDGAGLALTPIIGAPSLPGAPTDLAASPNETQIVLSWTAPAGYIASYKLYRDSVLIASPTGTTYTDTNLAQGTVYAYTVSAVNDVGEGPQSVSVSSSLVASTPASEIYVNAGGPSVTEGTITYAADSYFSGGAAYTTTDTNQLTALPAHLESARYGMSSYTFPATTRTKVRLHMVEYTFSSSHQRVFDIFANGGLVIDNLDLFAVAGKGNVVTREIVLDPVNGAVAIGFAASADNPIVSAIEVLDGTGLALTPLVTATEPDPTAPGTVITDGTTGRQAGPSDRVAAMTGTNTHFNYGSYKTDTPGGNSAIADSIIACGLRHVRDDPSSNNLPTIEKLGQAGVKWWSMFHNNPTVDVRSQVRGYFSNYKSVLGYIDGFLGYNEPDLSSKTSAEIRQQQIYLYQTLREDIAFNDLPITTYAATWPKSSKCVGTGNLSLYAEGGDYHPYPAGQRPDTNAGHNTISEREAMKDRLADRPHSFSPADWDYKDAWKTGGSFYTLSETGWHNNVTDKTEGHRGAHRETAAEYAAAMLLWYDLHGFARMHFYEYINQTKAKGSETSGSIQGSFGLVEQDLTPKPIWYALQRFLALYTDRGTAFTPGTLDYTLTGKISTVVETLHQKRDGTFLLGIYNGVATWDDKNYVFKTRPADVPVTFRFNKRNVQVRVHEPHRSANPSGWTSVAMGANYSLGVTPGAKILEIRAA